MPEQSSDRQSSAPDPGQRPNDNLPPTPPVYGMEKKGGNGSDAPNSRGPSGNRQPGDEQ